METVLRIALSNAALAAVAALLAWTAGKLARRPALTHALWLIVLLKLVTPPLWTVPLKVPQVKQRDAQREQTPKVDAPTQSPTLRQQEIARDMRCTDIVSTGVADVVTETKANDAATEPPEAARTSEIPPLSGVAWAGTPARAVGEGAGAGVPAHATQDEPVGQTEISPRARVLARATQDQAAIGSWMRWNWPKWAWPMIAIVWLAGAIVCLVVCIIRILSFQQLLRFAMPGPREMQDRVDVLSKRLQMSTGPRVLLVRGSVCPMVWPAGRRAAVLVPSALWDRLDARQRDTLLLHELAHLRRRDHWVRWFELMVTVLYWWNPICWWARHELREAEEQCCDAWVLWALPGSFKQYASALLEAVEFVSVRPSAPLLASGMGQFGDLRRRLTMLKQGEVARALSWSGLAAACGAGALLLSIAPTLAQSADKTDKSTENAPVPVTAAPAQNQQSNEHVNNNAPTPPGDSDKQDDAKPITAAAPLPPLTPAPVRVGNVAPTTPTALPTPVPIATSAAPVAVDEPTEQADDDDSGDSNKDSNFRRDIQRQKADAQRQQADAQRQQAEQQRQFADAKRAQARAQSELDRARRDVEMLSKRLAEASDRLKKLEMANAQADIAAKFPQNQFPQNQFDVETRDGKIVSVKPKGMPNGAQSRVFAGSGGGYAIVGSPAGQKDGKDFQMFGQPGAKGRSSSDDRERRLEAVERELSQLLKEVRQLRDEKGSAPRTSGESAR